MSDPGSVGPEKTSSPKTPISPMRNIIGIVVLIAVVAVGWIQYSQLLAFNAIVAKLDARAKDETASLMTVQEAEGLLGKTPDGPGTDFSDGNFNFTKKTYTWPALLKSYTLTAYYTKEKESHLHHFESEGAKLAPEAAEKPPGFPGAAPAKSGAPTKKPAVKIGNPKDQPAPSPAKGEKAPRNRPATHRSPRPLPHQPRRPRRTPRPRHPRRSPRPLPRTPRRPRRTTTDRHESTIDASQDLDRCSGWLSGLLVRHRAVSIPGRTS